MRTNFNSARDVRELTVTLTSADTTAVELYALPKQCRIIELVANVKTAFAGSETMNVGTADTGGYFATGIDISAVGHPTVIHFTPGVELTEVTTVKGAVTGGTGTVDLTCIYSLPQQART